MPKGFGKRQTKEGGKQVGEEEKRDDRGNRDGKGADERPAGSGEAYEENGKKREGRKTKEDTRIEVQQEI